MNYIVNNILKAKIQESKMAKKQTKIIDWLMKKHKELGVGLIVEMKGMNATKGKIESTIVNKEGSFKVKTQIKKLLKK